MARTALAWRGVGVAAGLSAVAGGPLDAQEVTKEELGTLPVVTVTAEFRPEDVQKVPAAITALTREDLESRSQQDLPDVAAQVPGVTLKPGGAGYGPALQAYIRGVGQYDYNFALEPGVGVYVDDVYYPTVAGSMLDLMDLERVEVLRGPQGTLAGRNSIGGALRLVSRKPDGSQESFVQGTVGSRARLDARAAANYTLVHDAVFLRLSTTTRHQQGYVTRLDYACDQADTSSGTAVTGDGCVLGTEGGRSLTAGRAALRVFAGSELEIDLIGDLTLDTSEVQATTLVAAREDEASGYGPQYIPDDPYVTYATFTNPTSPTGAYSIDPINHLSAGGVSASIAWHPRDQVALRSITAWRTYTTDFAADNDGSPVHRELVMNHLSHEQLSQELRLTGTVLGERLEYAAGGFYLTQENLLRNRVDLGYAGLDFLSDDPVTAASTSAFAHTTLHATRRLNLTAGGRYTTEYKDYQFGRLEPDGSPDAALGALNGVVGHYEGAQPDVRLAVDFTLARVMAYAQYATGFKGGGINPRPFADTQVQPFDPESLQGAEAGIKSSFLRDRARLNLAAFYNQYNDIVLTLLSCDEFSPSPGFPCAMPSNAGDAIVKGVEVEGVLRPLRALSLDGSVGTLDFDYTRIDARAQTSSGGGIQEGMITPFTPRLKASAGVELRLPAGGGGELRARADLSHQGEMYTNAVNAETNLIEAYTLAQARLTWVAPREQWRVAAEVTNLMDTLYYQQIFDLYGLAGFSSAQPGPGREWALSLTRRF